MKLEDGKTKFVIFIIILLIGLAYLIFNEYGVIKFVKLQNELNKVNEQIENIEKENTALKNEIDSLQKKIPAKIEKTAREKYNMIRPGEKVIEITEE